MTPRVRRSIAKAKIICQQCETEVKRDDDDIQCDKCAKIYHAICTRLDKRQYNHLLQNEKEEYVCHICEERSGCLSNELKEIKIKQNEITTKLDKLKQLDALQDSMQFMSTKFDDIVKTMTDNKNKLKALEIENKNLKDELNDLKFSVKLLSDSMVKNDCIIHGIEAEADSNAVNQVVKIMKDVGVKLNPNEIEDAYFLKKSDESESKKLSMVVKFANKKSKQTVLSTKQKLKANKGTENIFVNDYLSRQTLTLLKYAKSLKEVGYRRVYPMGGKIFAKMSELSKPKLLKNAEEVDMLLLESSKQRRSLRRGRAVLNCPSYSQDEADELYESPA